MSRVLGRTTTLTIAFLVLLVDQATKAAASTALVDGRTQPLVPGLLSLHLVHNTGAAFSLLNRSTHLLGLLSFVVSLALIVWICRHRSTAFWQALALAFLLGGTLGNGIDRWRLGHVVEFLALVPIDFPIFNGADVAINIAVLCFALDLWFNRHNTTRG